MEDLTTEATIGLAITLISMFVGWVVMARRDTKKRRKERDEERERTMKIETDSAYAKGQNDAIYTGLRDDVVAAHAKLRLHDDILADLKRSDFAHAEVHAALLTQLDQIHKTIDTIHRVIMVK